MEETRQHSALSAHPDARTFAAERLLESERIALAMAAGPLALLVTQVGLIAEAADWVRALATLCFLALIYCCAWQVWILNYGNYWLAAVRLGAAPEGQPGKLIVRNFDAERRFTEEGLSQMIRRSTLHYSVAYWVGGGSGLAVALGVIWA